MPLARAVVEPVAPAEAPRAVAAAPEEDVVRPAVEPDAMNPLEDGLDGISLLDSEAPADVLSAIDPYQLMEPEQVAVVAAPHAVASLAAIEVAAATADGPAEAWDVEPVPAHVEDVPTDDTGITSAADEVGPTGDKHSDDVVEEVRTPTTTVDDDKDDVSVQDAGPVVDDDNDNVDVQIAGPVVEDDNGNVAMQDAGPVVEGAATAAAPVADVMAEEDAAAVTSSAVASPVAGSSVGVDLPADGNAQAAEMDLEDLERGNLTADGRRRWARWLRNEVAAVETAIGAGDDIEASVEIDLHIQHVERFTEAAASLVTLPETTLPSRGGMVKLTGGVTGAGDTYVLPGLAQIHDPAVQIHALALAASFARLPGAVLMVPPSKQQELYGAVLAVVLGAGVLPEVQHEAREALSALHAALDPEQVLPELLRAQAVRWMPGVLGRVAPDALAPLLSSISTLISEVRTQRPARWGVSLAPLTTPSMMGALATSTSVHRRAQAPFWTTGRPPSTAWWTCTGAPWGSVSLKRVCSPVWTLGCGALCACTWNLWTASTAPRDGRRRTVADMLAFSRRRAPVYTTGQSPGCGTDVA